MLTEKKDFNLYYVLGSEGEGEKAAERRVSKGGEGGAGLAQTGGGWGKQVTAKVPERTGGGGKGPVRKRATGDEVVHAVHTPHAEQPDLDFLLPSLWKEMAPRARAAS